MRCVAHRLWAAAVTALVLSFGCTGVASAQATAVNLMQLTRLYESLLTVQSDERRAAIEERITAERREIRLRIEEEITALVQTEEEGETLDLDRALDRQRVLVSALQERLNDRRADLALLGQEETLYRQKSQATATGTVADVVTLTKSYPELLARRAVLEERVDVLRQMLSVQDERLQKLRTEQRLKRTRGLVTLLWYAAVFLLVFWLERIVRHAILTRIPVRRIRYGVIKTFSFVVYIALIFWFIQEIFTEHPTVLAALAVAGAATVISLQDVVKGIVGWLAQRENVAVGNRVTIGQIMGDVVDTGLLHTKLLVTRMREYDDSAHKGKIVTVPNAMLLTQPVVNLRSTSDYARVELPLPLVHARHWKRAKQILEEILHEETDAFAERAQWQMSRRMREFYSTEESPRSIVFTEIVDGGVQFTLCFPAPIGKRRPVATVVTEKILERFSTEGIELMEDRLDGTRHGAGAEREQDEDEGGADVVLGHQASPFGH